MTSGSSSALRPKLVAKGCRPMLPRLHQPSKSRQESQTSQINTERGPLGGPKVLKIMPKWGPWPRHCTFYYRTFLYCCWREALVCASPLAGSLSKLWDDRNKWNKHLSDCQPLNYHGGLSLTCVSPSCVGCTQHSHIIVPPTLVYLGITCSNLNKFDFSISCGDCHVVSLHVGQSISPKKRTSPKKWTQF